MEDPFVICPFFKNHKIALSKLKIHLHKCAKNHTMTGDTICPYNSQHIVDAAEILDHCSTCSDIQTLLFPANFRENKDEYENKTVSKDLRRPEPMVHMISTTEINYADKSVSRESNIKPRVITKSEFTPQMSQAASSIGHEDNQNVTKGVNSKYINGLLSDHLKLLTFNEIDYGEVYRQLEILEQEELIIEKRARDIKEMKQKLIEILKTFALKAYNSTPPEENVDPNINLNASTLTTYDSNETNNNDFCTNTNLNNNLGDEFDHGYMPMNFRTELEPEPEFTFETKSSFSPPKFSLPLAGVQGHNGTPRRGRGIANAYRKTKDSTNSFNCSEKYYNLKKNFRNNN